MNRLITMLAVFGTILFVGCNDSTVLDTEEKKDRAAKDIAGAGCDFYNALDSDNEQELSDAVDAFESLMIQHAEDQIYDKDRDQLRLKQIEHFHQNATPTKFCLLGCIGDDDGPILSICGAHGAGRRNNFYSVHQPCGRSLRFLQRVDSDNNRAERRCGYL